MGQEGLGEWKPERWPKLAKGPVEEAQLPASPQKQAAPLAAKAGLMAGESVQWWMGLEGRGTLFSNFR